MTLVETAKVGDVVTRRMSISIVKPPVNEEGKEEKEGEAEQENGQEQEVLVKEVTQIQVTPNCLPPS